MAATPAYTGDLFTSNLVLDNANPLMPGGTIDGTGQDALLIDFTCTLDIAALYDETYTNTATVDYSSQPGTPADDRSYPQETDSATTTTASPTIAKGIVATSLTETGDSQHTAGVTDLNIGETVTYELVVTTIEGTDTVQVVDNLPDVLEVVDATVESIGANVSSTNLTAGADLAGSAFITSADLRNGDTRDDTVTFDFGTVVNTGSDNIYDAADQIVVHVTAIVADVVGNVDNTQLVNEAEVQFTNDTQTDTATAEITEADLNVSKTTDTAGTVDAGDLVQFTLTVEHTAASTADAFNVVLTDTLPNNGAGTFYLVYDSLDTAASTCDTQTGFNVDSSAPPDVVFSFDSLALGSSCTIVFNGQVTSAVAPGVAQTNDVALAYTSTDVVNAETRDYTDSNSSVVNITNIAPVKSIMATSETSTDDTTADTSGEPRPVVVGEVLSYRLAISIPEGTSTDVVLDDQLSASIAPIFDDNTTVTFVQENLGDVTSSTAGLNPATNGTPVPLYDAGGSAQIGGVVNYNSGTNLLTFNLGTITNSQHEQCLRRVCLRRFQRRRGQFCREHARRCLLE